jgi:hypothetical protein
VLGEIIWEWPTAKNIKVLRCKGRFRDH